LSQTSSPHTPGGLRALPSGQQPQTTATTANSRPQQGNSRKTQPQTDRKPSQHPSAPSTAAIHPCIAGIARASLGNPVGGACGCPWPLVNLQDTQRVPHTPCPKLSRPLPAFGPNPVTPTLLSRCPTSLRTCRRKKNRAQHPGQPCQRISNLQTAQSPPAIPPALCRSSALGGANPARTHHSRPSALAPGITTAGRQRHPGQPLPNPQGNQPGATGETQTAHVGGAHHNASIKSGNAPCPYQCPRPSAGTDRGCARVALNLLANCWQGSRARVCGAVLWGKCCEVP